jgi:hypothetical protein
VNDADRRRSPDGFDDDAIFADIVAHLNDDAAPDEQTTRQADELAGQDSAADVDTDGRVTGESDAEPSTPPPGERPVGDIPRSGPGQWRVNPPPWPAKPVDPPVDPPVDLPVDPPVDPAPQIWRAHEVDDELEEHFEPPPVTPLPAGDLQFWAIIAGMTGGPLLLLYLVFFNRNAGSYWILVAIAMSVGGFAMLVSRMPGRRDDDDDGARL